MSNVCDDIAAMHTLSKGASLRNGARRSEQWLWQLTRIYSRLHAWVKDRSGLRIKGVGILLRRLKFDRVFEARGFRWFFDHRIATTYWRLIGGSYSEPETISLLTFVADQVEEPVILVDVGANIGEMVVAMAGRPTVARVIAFEPHPICVDVCNRNLALNGLRADVRSLLVADGTAQPYVIDPNYAPTSGIQPKGADTGLTPTVRLDDELAVSAACILLIDVEGAELAVMKGGQSFIRQQRPLIIFEYTSLLQRHSFTLSDVSRVLGAGYGLFRLRQDGRLDRQLDDTWNCVAVHEESIFMPICRQRIN
jgi:FkbM family methyltransferase